MKQLELNQMEAFVGGGDILTDSSSCGDFADTLMGVATIIGFASWWTGGGAGLAFGLGLAASATAKYCQTL